MIFGGSIIDELRELPNEINGQIWLVPIATTKADFPFTSSNTFKYTSSIDLFIDSPELDGEYKLYVVDEAGNISDSSIAKVEIDTIIPSNQDSVFTTSDTVKVGTDITILDSGEAMVWFAPENSSSFSPSSTMTESSTNTSIKAPAAEGIYHAYVMDAAGNVSDRSVFGFVCDPPGR